MGKILRENLGAVVLYLDDLERITTLLAEAGKAVPDPEPQLPDGASESQAALVKAMHLAHFARSRIPNLSDEGGIVANVDELKSHGEEVNLVHYSLNAVGLQGVIW